MKLFISYARIDKPYCVQIIELLDNHDIWYDQRLYAGQNWWNEILRRLEWCEGFVYLLSPESVNSDYCRREFELASSLGRPIFPVLIHPNTQMPENLVGVQYADLSRGLLAESVKVLLTAVHRAEINWQKTLSQRSIREVNSPIQEPAMVISSAAEAMEKGDYDQAVFLLRHAMENGCTSRFINMEALLMEAETALEQKSQQREIEREYKQIAALIAHSATSRLGYSAFAAFQREIPDYDPDHLADKLNPQTEQVAVKTAVHTDGLPLLSWCPIPAGESQFYYLAEQSRSQKLNVAVEAFYISKYPVTNAQFEVFVKDPHGYSKMEWWCASNESYQWYLNNLAARPSKFQGDERPREMVNWYEAIAFCHWLSQRLQVKVTLPTIFEWQRAFQGDDQRAFPWGNTFEAQHCNTLESELKMTSQVTRYPKGASPYGVWDMSGNVWEWCLNLDEADQFSADMKKTGKRVVRGGSFLSPGLRSGVAVHYSLKPDYFHAAIGFRIAYRD